MIKLYDYWRSSASYRLRIALNLKQIDYVSEEVSLHPDKLEQNSERYKALNPQKRVPALEIDGQVYGQSMALIEWLDETYPTSPFLPVDPLDRLSARAFADIVACDIHPLNNSSVLKYLREDFDADPEAVSKWYATWVARGFEALETLVQGRTSNFLFGDAPGLAEICLIPQIYNAQRFDVDLTPFPRLLEIDGACSVLKAFAKAAPEAVKPA